MKRTLSAAIAMLICICGFAQETKNQAELDLPEVYRDKNVVFWKLDNHTWIGSGNRVSSETLYLIEGLDSFCSRCGNVSSYNGAYSFLLGLWRVYR